MFFRSMHVELAVLLMNDGPESFGRFENQNGCKRLVRFHSIPSLDRACILKHMVDRTLKTIVFTVLFRKKFITMRLRCFLLFVVLLI